MRSRILGLSMLTLGLVGTTLLSTGVARAASECQSDSDCAAGMLCNMTEVPCQATCPPNAECFAPDPSCLTLQSQCVPRYLLPCGVDADCGDGFNCVETVECTCSGGVGGAAGTGAGAAAGTGSGTGGFGAGGSAPAAGGSAPATGGSAGIAGDGGCSCMPSGTGTCQAKSIQCQTAANCPAGWSCEAIGGGCAPEPGTSGAGGFAGSAGAAAGGDAGSAGDTGTAGTGIGGGGVGGSTPADTAGAGGCQTIAPVLQCMPPYSGGTAGTGGAYGTGGSGGSIIAPPPGGSAGSGSGGTGTGTTPTGANAGSHSGEHKAAGCSVASGDSGASASLWLVALGMLGLSSRRRRSA